MELSLERHRSTDDSHIVDVTLMIDGQALHGTAAAASHRAGIDEVVDKIERRAVDFKEKPRLRARPDEEKVILRRIADGQAERSGDRRIVKVKRFDIEPMFEEDALGRDGGARSRLLRLRERRDGAGRDLYRRDDGHFGLIEPVIGGEYTTGKSRGGADGRR